MDPTPEPRNNNSRKVGRDPLRNIRVDDRLWYAAQDAVVRRQDRSVSDVIRTLLVDYVRATNRMEARGQLPGQQRSEPD